MATYPLPADRPRRPSQRICAECGEPFAGRTSEELCDYCNEAAYQPSRLRLGEKLNGRRHPR